MLLNLYKSIIGHWFHIFKHWVYIFGALFLLIESYEVTTNIDLLISYGHLLISSFIISFVVFLADGFFFSGFLSTKTHLFQKNFGCKVVVQFGDMFKHSGWKVIGVNDFFDSEVDERVVSSKTLHGYVIKKFWDNRANDWDNSISQGLSEINGTTEDRPQGKNTRYPIGSTVTVEVGSEKFLFTAIAKTNIVDNVTIANAENIICAVRGMLQKARAVCANDELVLPLIGSGLARTGIPNKVLLDLIICGIYEEIKIGNVTGTIRIVVHPSKYGEINLLDVKRKWF